ncbi:MAG: nuclear transport factor 2 family protein [Sphingomonas sp.]
MAVLLLVVTQSGALARPAGDTDMLARDVDRLESLRAVKDLQRSYAQYSQFGLWDEMAGLFTARASFVRGAETMKGRAAIAGWLMRRGGGRRGLAPGALHTELIDEPLVNLAADGRTAKGRWMSLSLLGDGKGAARIEGGIYENDYVREGRVWKIAAVHYHPQFSGNYADGWINEGGGDLPMIPFHFSVDESGVPVAAPVGPAPRGRAPLDALEARIAALGDEDAVRNVQSAYGYYVDRKMWDDVVDLFAEDGAAEVAGAGMFRGKGGVRRAMELMGPAGLGHGQLNDRPQFDVIVRILPGGREAISRGIELAMLGEADKGTAHWEISVFRNRYVKEGGLWKLKELRTFPIVRADYFEGWGKGGLAGPVAWVPAFLGANPATGKPVDTLGLTVLGATPLTGAIATPDTPAPGSADRVADARRRLARSYAWDGVENVSSAYGYYIDDFQWPQMAAIFAVKGNKQSPFTGYYMGRDRIMQAVTVTWGAPPLTRPGISYHWRTQPVIHVSADGRSANLRTRLFQPRTGKQPWAPGAASFYGAQFAAGMYPNDQVVLEDGVWRLWSLTIDEPYFTSLGWKGGWSSVKDPPPGAPPPPPLPLLAKFPPDIRISDLGRREEGFRGGTGTTIEWPGILPMWFHYRNPVSGRTPERYWPDCVPCEALPESRMTAHGYQMPPTGPEVDGVEVP